MRVGPIRKQAQDVVELLTDAERCQVMLVTVAEETPVNELVETAFAIEDRAGVALGPVVVNGCVAPIPDLTALAADPGLSATFDADPATLVAAAEFRLDLERRQRGQAERLARMLPLPHIHLPFLFTAGIGPGEIDLLADALTDGVHAPSRRRRDLTRAARRSSSRAGTSSCAAARAVSARPPPRRRWPSRARRGRATVVVTIDPAARRMPPRAPVEYRTRDPRAMGRRRHRRRAAACTLMLDPKSTFDHLVAEYARDEEQAQRILENALYRNIAGSLSGTQEYMAMEKLHELHVGGGFDLVVVDTPPTRHAPTSSTRPDGSPACSTTRLPAAQRPRPAGVRVGAIARRPSCGPSRKWWAPRSSTTCSPSSAPSRGWRASAPVPTRHWSCWRRSAACRPRHLPAERRSGEAEFFADRLADGALAVEALVVNRVHPLRGRAVRRAASPRDRARAEAVARNGAATTTLRRLAAQYPTSPTSRSWRSARA